MDEKKLKAGKNIRARRKTRKRLIAGTIAGILVTGGIGAAVYAKVSYQSEEPKEVSTAQSATAKLGSVSNTIVGTGNLELETAQAFNIPSGIEIKQVLVESGDYVEKGGTLAEVDKTSVLSAVEDIQEEIRELDEQLSTCLEDEEADTIDTVVDGRVKLIYAAPEQDVAEMMLESGALMVLSLDGKMAVDIPHGSGNAAEGDSVIVTLSSGTQVSGSVETADGSGWTVTLTDDGTVYDDVVSVAASDGSVLGQGSLYIHQPLEITGTAGVVENVNVAENQSVTAGTALLTLKDTVNENEYQELLARRDSCTQSLKRLLTLTKDQSITAEYSGTVQEVNVAANGSSVSNSSSGMQTSQMSYTNNIGKYSAISLAFTDNSQEEVIDAEENLDADIAYAYDEEPAVVEEPAAQALYFDITSSGASTSSVLVIPAPAAGNTSVTDASSADGSYSASVVWNPSAEIFEPDTDYQALVILSASDGYVFTSASVRSMEIGALSGVQVSEDGKSMELQIAFPRTAQADNENSTDSQPSGETPDRDSESGSNGTDGVNGGAQTGATSESDGNQTGSGELTDGSSQAGDGESAGGSNQTGDGESAGGSSQTGSGTSTGGSSQTESGTPGNSTSQSGAGSNAGDSAQGSSSTGEQTSDGNETDSQKSGTVEESGYSTDVTAFTISPDDFMQLTVSVDELDINSLELGQKAVVTFDAIEDEEFEGEVTSIGSTASVNGGVAKYSVGIKVSKDERMRQGMNASATIVIESKENVVTLPMLALQEKGNKVFVYTAQNDDGTLTGEQEITTGLSNGSTVEITEGLSEGDVVYYQRTGSTQQSGSETGAQNKSGGFGENGGMGQMGENGSRPERSGQSGSSGGSKTPPEM